MFLLAGAVACGVAAAHAGASVAAIALAAVGGGAAGAIIGTSLRNHFFRQKLRIVRVSRSEPDLERPAYMRRAPTPSEPTSC